MRLGTSGFGVIALVSLLVTATPERNKSGSKDPSEGRISWPVSVVRVSSTNDQTRRRFVKIKNDRKDSSSRSETSSIPLWPFSHPPIASAKDRRRDETGTEVSRFGEYLLASSRVPRLALNFKRSLKYPSNDWSEDNALGSFADEQSEYKVRSDTNVVTVVSSSRKFREKFLVTLDSPISNFMRVAPTPRSFVAHPSHAPSRRRRDGGRHRRWKRETIRRDEETKSLNRYDDKESTREKNQLTVEKSRNEERSSTVESAITMSHGITTMTSRTNKSVYANGREFTDVNFRKATERYESQIMRNFPEPVSNNSSDNPNEYHNDQTELIFNSTPRTITPKSSNLANSDNSFMANYPPVKYSKVLMIDITENPPVVARFNDRGDRAVNRFVTGDLMTDKLTDYVAQEKLSSDLNPNGSRDENLVRDLGLLKEIVAVSTPTTLIELTVRKHETPFESTVTEEIALRTKQITQESLPEVPIIGTETLKLGTNVRDTNPIDIASLDNHKAIRVRSFQTTSDENEKQGDTGTDTSSLFSRSSSDNLHHKDETLQDEETYRFNDKMETSKFGVNQISFGKSSYTGTKNTSKPLINFLDGKSNKTFYEIKPSVITDMDRPDELDFPTTTRQSFDKFLLSSVPSVFGKFGPYFLDKEDGRNVTKRIGSTVQLDCRIGFLGNRTVTWLRHYIDSFRLLTVNQASYSVDRRISLKFTYPDNWRLQIAYASMRDSGLYKCQVEIDPNKSLVKKYNVIITAPILTITDDSGRPVSGERHLKAGSTLKLRCEARDVMQGLNESVLWMRGDETLTDDVSENRTTEIVNENEVTVVISTLFVDKAIPRHAGNYSCVVPDKAKTTIAVHVLNGELPAAVQHGSGVSTAVLNIWLVHLTASYGFFR